MKPYVELRNEDGSAAVNVEEWQAGRLVSRKPLQERLDLWNHSPTGLEWGYAGSGPAQLALALIGF
jgi:hypothetical protein